MCISGNRFLHFNDVLHRIFTGSEHSSQNHGSFAGILCSGIVGGAGGPLFVSLLSDTTSLRIGMLLILVFMGYITFIGFWAHPLVNNKTVSLKELVGFKNKIKY